MCFIATQHPDEARAFYGDTLGLNLVEHSPYALAFQDGDTMLRVQIVADLSPAGHTVHGWQVSDMEHEVEALTAKGVTFLKFNGLDQNDVGVWTTPDGNKIAWFKDPSGNTLSLTEFTDGSSSRRPRPPDPA